MESSVADLHFSFAVGLGVFPTLLVFLFVKGEPAWSIKSLASGCLLVLIATYFLAIMTDLESLMPWFANNGHVTTDEASAAASEIKVWTLIFPAIVGAIGANYITSWLQSSKPKADR